MGQDHSNPLGESPSPGSSFPSFLTSKAKGVSPKSGRGPGKVVVVKTGNEGEQSIAVDEELKKLQEIPAFYPILRNSLNIADVKDPPDLFTKFDHRPTYALCQRLQEHLAITSEIVANEQASLGIRVREIDYAIATMSNILSERDKSLTRMTADLVKIKEINAQMVKITAQLQEIVPLANELSSNLNSLLSMTDEQDRIPSLNFSFILKPDTPPGASSVAYFSGTEEQRVVDVSDMEPDYNLIGTSIDLNQVDPISQKRLLAFFNFWLTQTVRLLNDCASQLESKLLEVDNRLRRLEVTMALLEAKLASIPGLDIEKNPASVAATNGVPPQQNIEVKVDKEKQETPAVVPEPVGTTVNQVSTGDGQAEQQPVEETEKEDISKDPRYAKYFKMLQLGVPEEAVKQKMELDGVDSSILQKGGSRGAQSSVQQSSSAAAKKPTKKDQADSDSFSESDESSFSD